MTDDEVRYLEIICKLMKCLDDIAESVDVDTDFNFPNSRLNKVCRYNIAIARKILEPKSDELNEILPGIYV